MIYSLRFRQLALVLALAGTVFVGSSRPAMAHCDTVDGPVVGSARQALARGDVTSVLKWIGPEHEAEVAAVFAHVRTVRSLGDEARELADRFFFETLVRLHREGEGFGYAGLKVAGSPVSPAVLAADMALESGSDADLVAELTGLVAAGVRSRFEHARETRAHAEENVAAGREYVAAYVDLTHYAEGLEAVATGHSAEHEAESGVGAEISGDAAISLTPSQIFELPAGIGPGEGKEVTVLLDDSRVKLAIVVLRGGTVLPSHSAPVPTTIQVLEGNGVIHVAGDAIAVSRGTLVVLAAGEDHDVVPEPGSDMSVLVHYLRSAGDPASPSATEHAH